MKLDRKVTKRLNRMKSQRHATKKVDNKKLQRFVYKTAQEIDAIEKQTNDQKIRNLKGTSQTGRFPSKDPEPQELPKVKPKYVQDPEINPD